MTRAIIYLDHSVLSSFARDRLPDILAQFQSVAHADRALFPVSWIHHYEAELDSRLEKSIREVSTRLSRGVRLQTPGLTVQHQARRAYLKFIGQEAEAVHRNDAYQLDPNGPISERLQTSMQRTGVTTSAVGRQARRANKELFARSLEERRAEALAQSFDEAKGHWAREAVQLYFRDPLEKSMRDQLDDLVVPMLEFGAGVLDEAFGISNVQMTPEEVYLRLASVTQFFESMEDLPFIDLHSSILASLEFDESARPYQPGDFFDLQTWSAYLPYVDVAVADQQMCAVLNRRGLAAKYGCKVFPHTTDGLQAVVSTIQAISG